MKCTTAGSGKYIKVSEDRLHEAVYKWFSQQCLSGGGVMDAELKSAAKKTC